MAPKAFLHENWVLKGLSSTCVELACGHTPFSSVASASKENSLHVYCTAKPGVVSPPCHDPGCQHRSYCELWTHQLVGVGSGQSPCFQTAPESRGEHCYWSSLLFFCHWIQVNSSCAHHLGSGALWKHCSSMHRQHTVKGSCDHITTATACPLQQNPDMVL